MPKPFQRQIILRAYYKQGSKILTCCYTVVEVDKAFLSLHNCGGSQPAQLSPLLLYNRKAK
jgi:hypothetical protein